jgi:NADPH:quinone reductase-like Zn-dependent oxidoreductase
MKAVVQDRYGPPEVLRIDEVERPVPRDDETLIRVRASTVSQTDTHVRAAHPFFWRLIGGLRRPPRMGGGCLRRRTAGRRYVYLDVPRRKDRGGRSHG